MGREELQAWLDSNAKALEVPGVAVGVYHNGQEDYAFYGVTSVDNPLDVDENTFFLYGSTQKTYTATAIMVLADQGKLSLDDPVKKHIPEFTLKDKDCEERVTVLQLLNHTSGWQGDVREDCGENEDALERFVEFMATVEQVTPVGTAFSYNNAALNVAGRVVEKVTGKEFGKALKELLLDPIGLENTLFNPLDVMVRRFSLGHRQGSDDKINVARPWHLSRASIASGGWGVSATAPDQIAWAKFHLGDGTGKDGKRVLSKELLDKMKQPTYEIPGSALGEGVGISWFFEDVDGVRLVSHGGDVIGQHSSFVMCPQAHFAVIVLTNLDGGGSQLKEQAVRFALEHYIGVVQKDPEPVNLSDEQLAPYTGTYETVAAIANIATQDGGLVLNVEIKPEARAQLFAEDEEIPDQPPIPLGMLGSDNDFYIVTDGPAKGMRGYFIRDADGNVDSVHVGGRLATRVKESVAA